MSVEVEFFFDLSSPWTRLAFANIRPRLEGLDDDHSPRVHEAHGCSGAFMQGAIHRGNALPYVAGDPKRRRSCRLRRWR